MRLIDADKVQVKINVHGTNKFGMLDDDIREFIDKQETVEAIPIEWILNNPKYPTDKDKAKVIEDMIEDWRKEND